MLGWLKAGRIWGGSSKREICDEYSNGVFINYDSTNKRWLSNTSAGTISWYACVQEEKACERGRRRRWAFASRQTLPGLDVRLAVRMAFARVPCAICFLPAMWMNSLKWGLTQRTAHNFNRTRGDSEGIPTWQEYGRTTGERRKYKRASGYPKRVETCPQRVPTCPKRVPGKAQHLRMGLKRLSGSREGVRAASKPLHRRRQHVPPCLKRLSGSREGVPTASKPLEVTSQKVVARR